MLSGVRDSAWNVKRPGALTPGLSKTPHSDRQIQGRSFALNGNTTLPVKRGRSRITPHGDPARLTPGQRHTLEFIWDYFDRHGEAPTIREICEDAGVSALMTGWRRLQSLALHGMLTTEPYTERGIRVLVWPPKGWTRPARELATKGVE